MAVKRVFILVSGNIMDDDTLRGMGALKSVGLTVALVSE
jgi:hypothetical protein